MTTAPRTLILTAFACGLLLAVAPQRASASPATSNATPAPTRAHKPLVTAQAGKAKPTTAKSRAGKPRTAKPRSSKPAARSVAEPARKKLKRIEFTEGDSLEGGVNGPNGEDIQGRTDPIHSSLIRLRQDFLPEIYKSAEVIP